MSSQEQVEQSFYPKDEDKEVVLEVNDLKKWFPVDQQGILTSQTVAFIKAVNGVSFKLYKGETLGLVGESGCGKSTIAKLITGLETPTDGNIFYRGINVLNADPIEKFVYKSNIQMIFQDPFSSLNPRMKILDILKEPYTIKNKKAKKHAIDETSWWDKIKNFLGIKNEDEDNKQEINLEVEEETLQKRILKLLNVVGLENYHALRYPHEFSGGQRQRVGVARALAMSPEVIVADEPVSALDVSIQAQILNLLRSIQKNFNLTYLFIAHDLSVVKHVSDRIMVMYLGKLMEIATKEDLYNRPAHPYTISLLSAIPRVDPEERKERIILEGDVPSPISPPSGCVFSSRCYKAKPDCSDAVPELREIRENQYVACFYPEMGEDRVKEVP